MICPANPPLPCPLNFPFHPLSGSHTSMWIAESALGVATTWTRQNAASFFAKPGSSGRPDVPSGGATNSPAPTREADRIFAPLNVIFCKLSQDCCVPGAPELFMLCARPALVTPGAKASAMIVVFVFIPNLPRGRPLIHAEIASTVNGKAFAVSQPVALSACGRAACCIIYSRRLAHKGHRVASN